jgi:ribosomal protein L40E
MEAAAQAPVEGVMQKRCNWCGALNPWTAAVCESCEARFPVPEQDEAFRRAAEERLRQDEAALDFWRQRRKRGWRRFLI